jgi:hypothetical protein
LREAGCEFVRRGKSDHDIWRCPITKRNFAVEARIRSRRTTNAVLKQAGLAKRF